MAQDTEMRLVNGLPRSYTTADNVENFTNDASAVAVGDAVYISAAGKVSKASNATAAQECTGLVFEVTDTTNCRVITRGILEGVLSGATPNTRYYLGATAGTLVTAKPSGTEVIQVVGLAYNTDDLMVVPQVGITVNPVGATTFDDVYNNSGASPTVTVDNGPLILTGAGTTGSPGPALRMNDDNLIAFGTAGTDRLGYDSDVGAMTLGPSTGSSGLICAGVLLFSELDGSPISVPGVVVDIAYESGTTGSTGLRASHAGNVAVSSLIGTVKGFEVEIEGNTGDHAAVTYTGVDVRTITKASSSATFTGIEVGADWDYPLHMADDAPIWLGDGYDWSLQHLSSSGGVGALTAAVEESNFRFLNGTWDFYGRTDGATTTCHGTPKDDTGNIALNVRLENATEHGGAALGAGEEIFGVLLTTFGRSGDDATGQYTGFDTGSVSKATSPSDFVAIKVRSTWDTGILVEDDTPVVLGTGSDSSISWIDASNDLRLTAPHLHLAATAEISDTAYDPISATLGTYPLKVSAEAGAAADDTMAIRGILFNTGGATRTGGTFAAFGTSIGDKGADTGGEYVGYWAPNPSMTGAGTATALKVEGAAWDVGLDIDNGGAFIADGVTIESAKSGTMGLEMDGLDIGAAANEIGDIFQGSFIRMAQTSTPTDVLTKGFIYTKAASGVAELHYLDSAGTERQLTGTAATTPSLDDIYDNSAGSSYTITTDAGPVILTGGSPGMRLDDDITLALGTGSDSSITWINASNDLRLTAPHLHLAATVEISDTAYDPIPLSVGVRSLKAEGEAASAASDLKVIEGVIFNTGGTTRTGGTFAAFGTSIADKGADSGGEYVGYWASNPSMTGSGTATAIKVEGAAWDVGIEVDNGGIFLPDDQEINLGNTTSTPDVFMKWDTSLSGDGLHIQVGSVANTRAKTVLASHLILEDEEDTPLYLFSVFDASKGLFVNTTTDDDEFDQTVIYAKIDTSGQGSRTTGGTTTGVGSWVEGHADDSAGNYYAFRAYPAINNGGTTPFTGLFVETGFDVGIEVDSGGILLAEMATPTAGVANKGFVYTKDVSTVTELHYLDSAGVERQLTGTAATTPSLDDIYDNSAGSSYTITTDAGPIILTGGTPAMRFNDSAALEFGTGSDTSLVWDGSSLALAVPDNTVGVFTITEGANSYFYISTDDVSPLMQFGNSATDPSYSFQGSGTVIFNGDMAISERTGDPGAFANYGYVYTKDISTITELFYSDSAGTATQITTNGSIANAHILPDNTVSAFTITEGANEYLNISTDDVSPLMQFGNSATNPGYSFQGSGTVIFNGDTAIQKRVGDPGAFSNYGYVYTKDVSGTVELFYSDDGGTPTQLTGGGGGSGSLDAAYNAGRTITVDAGPIVCNTATTNGGTLDINPSFLTETAYQVDVTWPAGAYTGTLGGLNIDYSGTTTITNAADVYGINLTGKANSDVVGDSVGLNVGAGWDLGVRVADDVLLSFGNDDDANLLWVSAGFPGLYIQSGATGSRTSIGLLGYTTIRDGANLLDLSSALGSTALGVNVQAGTVADTVFGIYADFDNSGGTQRTGGSASCVSARPTGKADDLGGDYNAFEARNASDSGGAGTFYGLTIGSGYDVGIEVSSGGINLHDDVQVSFGNGSDTTLEFLTATDDFVIDHTNASGDVIVRLGSDSTGPTFQVQQDDETALFTVQPFTGANGLATFGVQTGWSGPLGSGGMGGQLLSLNATSNSATSSTQTIDLTVNNATGTALTSGSMRGIDILMSGHGSDGASSDYYGLTMAASDGGGSATYTGILMNSGWDVGIALWDNIPLAFGSSDDVTMRWDGTDMDVLGLADDQGWVWGNGTNNWDMTWYGSAVGNTMFLDSSINELQFDGITPLMGDDIPIYFGDDKDAEVEWNTTYNAFRVAAGVATNRAPILVDGHINIRDDANYLRLNGTNSSALTCFVQANHGSANLVGLAGLVDNTSGSNRSGGIFAAVSGSVEGKSSDSGGQYIAFWAGDAVDNSGSATFTGVEVGDNYDIGVDVQSGGIKLHEQSAPSTPTNAGMVYVKDVSGTSELFFMRDDGTEVQLS